MSIDLSLSPKGKKVDSGKLNHGNGYLKTYSLDGLLEGEGPMKNGAPHGYWKYYAASGKVIAEGNLANSKRMGAWKFFNSAGVFVEEEQYLFDEVVPGP